MSDHPLPSAIDVERAVLGSCLLFEEHVESARLRLRPEDLHLDGHRRTFAAIIRLDDAGTAIDPLTVSQELADSKELAAAGGQGYVSDLTTGIPRRISIEDWIDLLKEKARLRKLISMAERISSSAYEQGDEACVRDPLWASDQDFEAIRYAAEKVADWPLFIAIVSRTQDAIQALLTENPQTEDTCVSSAIIPLLDRMNDERTRSGELLGLPTGIPAFDLVTRGLQGGQNITIAAWTGNGKSSAGIQAATENARRGTPVLIFSVEMTKEDILRRVFSAVSGWSPTHRRRLRSNYSGRWSG